MDKSWMRQEKIDILRYLPAYPAKDTQFKATNGADSMEHERIRLALQDEFDQLFVGTATWGLDDWEKFLGIDIDYGNKQGYEVRRAAVIAKMISMFTMTRERVTELMNLFAEPKNVSFTERYSKYTIDVHIPWEDKVYVKQLKKNLDEYLPAHIAYTIAMQPAYQARWNQAGVLVTVKEADTTLTEKISRVVFECGTNAAGRAKTWTETKSSVTNREAYVFFGRGLSNGTLKYNSGGFGQDIRDVGTDHTDTWRVFTASGRTNGRMRPTSNAANSAEKSKTYHVADMRNVLLTNGRATNSGKKSKVAWTEKREWTVYRKKFIHPAYMTNSIGQISREYKDVGSDVTITAVTFDAGTTNRAQLRINSDSRRLSHTERWKVFTSSRITNAKETPKANAADSATRRRERTETENVVQKLFLGGLTNGRLTTNACHKNISEQVVHIAKWRMVTMVKGGSRYNACNSRTITDEVKHVIPGLTRHRFDAKTATLTNGKYVRGYLRV